MRREGCVHGSLRGRGVSLDVLRAVFVLAVPRRCPRPRDAASVSQFFRSEVSVRSLPPPPLLSRVRSPRLHGSWWSRRGAALGVVDRLLQLSVHRKSVSLRAQVTPKNNGPFDEQYERGDEMRNARWLPLVRCWWCEVSGRDDPGGRVLESLGW
ncbi:hypothetical protein LX36DRAFT_370632 [Colletotrichum falcatum]|nr:hypothetical protein LX36DRAFT_370632 [Colletotrichum falcatum]